MSSQKKKKTDRTQYTKQSENRKPKESEPI